MWGAVQKTLKLGDAQLAEFQAEFWGGDQIDAGLVEWLASLRPRWKTGLLTNAWSRDPLAIFTERFGLPAALVNNAFDAVISSAVVGIRKPDARIYMAALQTLGVDAAQTVFVDDFSHNVDGARDLGMHAIHFHNRDQALLELEALLGMQG